jgi:hypothetical protein
MPTTFKGKPHNKFLIVEVVKSLQQKRGGELQPSSFPRYNMPFAIALRRHSDSRLQSIDR